MVSGGVGAGRRTGAGDPGCCGRGLAAAGRRGGRDLEEAEELVARRPGLMAVTAEGDCSARISRRAVRPGRPACWRCRPPSTRPRPSWRSWRALRRSWPGRSGPRADAVRRGRAGRGARRAAPGRGAGAVAVAASSWAGSAGRPRARPARPSAAPRRRPRPRRRWSGPPRRPRSWRSGCAAAEEDRRAAATRSPDTSGRDRLAADGANARQTEMEARLQLRTHEERVKALAGRADCARPRARGPSARRGPGPSAAGPGCGTRRRWPERSPPARGSCWRTSRCRWSGPRRSGPRPSGPRPSGSRRWSAERNRGRELKGELDKLTDSVHRGEVLGAEKRLRIEQLETRALEELGMEPAGLIAEYGPDQPVAAVAARRGRGAAGGSGASAQPAGPVRPGRAGEAAQGGRAGVSAARAR